MFYRYAYASDAAKHALNVMKVPINPCFGRVYRYVVCEKRLKFAKVSIFMDFGGLLAVFMKLLRGNFRE